MSLVSNVFKISIFLSFSDAAGPIDEDLFEDEDLDELQDDITNLEL